MSISEEELQVKRDTADQLREELAAAKAERLSREAGLVNAVNADRLDNEIANLARELEAERAAAGGGKANAGPTAKEIMQAAADKAAEKAASDREAADRAAAEKAEADKVEADKAAADKEAADNAAAAAGTTDTKEL